MNAMATIRNWVYDYTGLNGKGPDRIVVTRDEIDDLQRDCSIPCKEQENSILGIPFDESHYAKEIRARQIEIPMMRIAEVEKFDPMYSMEFTRGDHPFGTVSRRAMANVLGETTHIMISVESDCLSWLKRLLGLAKWWPIKNRTVSVDGRVLYPFLKIQLPHNRHSVRFMIRQ